MTTSERRKHMEEQFIRDHMLNVNHQSVANAVMAIVDALQHTKTETQITSSGIIFLMVCERYGIKPREILNIVDNILNRHEGRRAEYEAARMYMKHEWY